MIDSTTVEPRKISLILMIAIYVAPILFWWFLLRRGYANSTRIAAFTYALVTFVAGVIIALSDGKLL